KMYQKAALGVGGVAACGTRSAKECGWTGKDAAYDARQEPRFGEMQDMRCPFHLGDVVRIDQLLWFAAQRIAQDRVAARFHRPDFPSDEGVTGSGILIGEIRDAHRFLVADLVMLLSMNGA